MSAVKIFSRGLLSESTIKSKSSISTAFGLTSLNSLPNHVVSADTINTFKNRLDKFRSDQEVLYDYNADLHGIGNRSLL